MQVVPVLLKLPVKLIIRLCTDDERVRDMFNTMDARFDSCDVLDDFWGEALEVYLHNPWLTYGMGLHRLREAGLAPEIMDDLDERPLSLDELHEFCHVLFVGGDDDIIDLPHPKKSWSAFIRALNVLVEKEKKQWNPIKKMATPWINLKKLDAMHRRRHHRSRDSHGSRHHHHQHGQQRRSSTHSSQSKDPPESHSGGSSPRHQNRQHRSTLSGAAAAAASNADLTLTQVLQRWSHQPSDYKKYYPLQHLLVTVPQTFPPTNTKVEPHDYFKKWKTFDEEAFADESGDELKELLKRAVRKAKFFLHPDKLPKDLTENQTLLFKTIWDVLADRSELL